MSDGARRLATRFVSIALLVFAVAILAGGVWLLRSGGAGGIVAGIVVVLAGLAVALAALFFLLVPHRLDNLREMQEEYEAEHGPYEPE